MSGILIHNFNLDVRNPLSHRGPDSSGYVQVNGWKMYGAYSQWKMHHSRLSIQDVSDAASQPYSTRDGTYLLYNGQIYNHKELRSKYFNTTQFTTTGDTELLYHILISERYDLLDKIDGIFAFVFYNNNQIIYARDPFGVKPLFKFDNRKKFALSSELQIFFELTNLEINSELLPEFIKYCFIGLDNTIYKNVSKVLPGRIYIQDEMGVSEKVYTTVFDNIDRELPIDNEEILFDIKSAVESQLIADVEVGLALSGGIDSTLLAKFVPKNTKSFSTVFFKDFKFDESKYIDTVTQKYGLQNIKIPFEEPYFEKNLSSVFYRRGGVRQPFPMAMEQLAQEASSHVKVLLTGAGADGLFLNQNFQEIGNDFDIVNNYQFFTTEDAREFFNWSHEKEYMAKDSRMKFLHNSNKSIKAKIQMLEVYHHLSHYNEMLDLAYMKYSVEARAPYLGQSFAKKMLGIPCNQTSGKILTKNLVGKEFGKEFAYRNKIGYTTPYYIWMYSDFCYDLIVSIIKTSETVNSYIKKRYLDNICQRTGVYNDTYRYQKLFWTILNLGRI